jgi:phosphoesterase RecJ-like protein
MKTTYEETTQIKEIIDKAQHIVIVQADNPDADSLGSALALEHILSDIGKKVDFYCAVEVPSYLRYMSGWDRINKDLPRSFDASIVVDASTMTLLEKLTNSGQKGWLANKPCVVLDHHESVDNVIPFATVMLNDHLRSSAGELIYLVARQLEWPVSKEAQEFLMLSILGDTQGLSNQLASAETYKIMANMIENGVSRPELEERRREFGKMPALIFRYKAKLIERTALDFDGRIASVMVPQAEINQYSPLYNPGPLVQNDMLQTVGVSVAIVFKSYDDGKVTAAIRCNPGAGIAAELAEHFGGGGHAYASGFKVTSGGSFDKVKQDCLNYARELLEQIDHKSD